ncbi:Elongation factor-like GTPase 1 [Eumeta japonica]|uniref:Elongation factor-like GTPase 1 n=1 Tax=Eumeta variegata TaxID=151549 RepID=A0A4C1YFD1_EUMVA|nr:Elongation factor-like GTPase 1 [Eumeta japonica]
MSRLYFVDYENFNIEKGPVFKIFATLAACAFAGRVQAAVGRRCGRAVAADLVGGSASFRVRALLPVAESFRFALELRTHTSGLAAPNMIFSHWEVMDIDPNWRPRTAEEYAQWGEKWDGVNRAKAYVEAVRKRKGLASDTQLVQHAEKQRTLSKNK